MRPAVAGWFVVLVAGPIPAQPKADPDGAPLPPGAVARLGTTLYRTDLGWRSSYSLSPDGTRLAGATAAGVTVWDLTTGRVAYRLADKFKPVPQVHGEARLLRAVFTPDGKHLVVADTTHVMQVFDAATGTWVRAVSGPEKVAAIPKGFTFSLAVADVLPCPAAGRLLVRVGSGYLFLVNPADWSWTYHGQVTDDVTAASADARRVVTHQNVDALYEQCDVVDLPSGKSVAGLHVPDGAWYAALSADGRLAAAGGYRVRLRDVAKKEIALEGVDDKSLRGIVRSLAFTPDGKTLLACPEYGRSVVRWDTATGKRLPDLPGSGPGPALASADGTRLVTVGDGVIRRFDLTTGKEIAPADGFAGPLAVALSPDGKLAVVGDGAGQLRTWAAPFTGEPTTLRRSGSSVDDIAFSADGKGLFAAHGDRTVSVWDVTAGKEVTVLRPPPGELARTQYGYSPPTRVGVSADGSLVAAGVFMLANWVADVATGRILWERRAEPDEKGDGVTHARPVFAADGSALYLGLQRGQIGVFDPRTGREVLRIRLPEFDRFRWNVNRLVLSPDGRSLLAEVSFNDARLYRVDMATGQVLWRQDVKHEGAIWGLAFTPDGRTVLSTHADGAARAWDAATGGPADRLRVLPVWAGEFALSADGRLLFAPAPGATALVWALGP
jgi:WD40 repeat protein